MKETIILSVDNWADYFTWEYPDELVKGLPISEDGIPEESDDVQLLRAWIAAKNLRSPTLRFDLSPFAASVILDFAVELKR